MPEPRDPRSIIEAAEQAAAVSNYAAAEELLREAALLQESRLGLLHPDLANTLNNLGVVCERTDNPVDAEDCFRRAFAIATAVLPQDHPFVATSRKNLRDFCEARGIPVDTATSPPAVTDTLEASATPEAPATSEEAPATAPLEPPRESLLLSESQDVELGPSRSFAPLAIGTLTAGAMLIVILFAARSWLSSSKRPEPSTQIAIAPTRETPAPPPMRHSPEPIALPTAPTKMVESRADGVRTSRIAAAPTPGRPTVVKARLCAELEEWRCDPPDRPVPPGLLFFYTQVKSSSPTSVTHRWYRGNRLYQSVDIRVQASPSGYRTYSRHTMSSENAGDWRVELRAEDGTVLHEERFSVR